MVVVRTFIGGKALAARLSRSAGEVDKRDASGTCRDSIPLHHLDKDQVFSPVSLLNSWNDLKIFQKSLSLGLLWLSGGQLGDLRDLELYAKFPSIPVPIEPCSIYA